MSTPDQERLDEFVRARRRVTRFKLQPSAHPYVGMLEKIYMAQVYSVDRLRLKSKTPRPTGLNEKLRRWERAFREKLHLVRGAPVVAAFGSARTSVAEHPACANANETIDLLGDLCYRLGIGLMTGHFHRGWMWTCLNAWLAARARYRQTLQPGEAVDDGVLISGVPLLEPDDKGLEGVHLPTSEQAELLRLMDAVFPPQAFFEARGPAIMGSAETLLSVYGPDGIGTSEEMIRDILGEQHRNMSLTVWSERPTTGMREVFLLDSNLGNGLWGYDWVLLKALNNVTLTSTSASDWSRVNIVRIGRPSVDGGILGKLGPMPVKVLWFPDCQAAAEHLVDQAIAVHEALRTAYLKLLSNGAH